MAATPSTLSETTVCFLIISIGGFYYEIRSLLQTRVCFSPVSQTICQHPPQPTTVLSIYDCSNHEGTNAIFLIFELKVFLFQVKHSNTIYTLWLISYPYFSWIVLMIKDDAMLFSKISNSEPIQLCAVTFSFDSFNSYELQLCPVS